MQKSLFLLFAFLSLNVVFGQNLQSGKEIVENAILNKNKNQFDFETLAYQKLIVTANPDKVEGKIDSIFKETRKGKVLKSIDSSDYNFKKYIEKQHVYLTEKLSRFYHNDKKTKEYILATKMAGFEEPVYEFFSLNLVPFILYDNKYIVVEKKFTNPVSVKGLNKYEFSLLEKTTIDNRLVYKVSFNPKKVTKHNNLEGVLFIDAQNFAIAKLQLKQAGLLNVYSQHDFQFLPEKSKWIPVRTKLTVKKGKSKAPIKILGETIVFEGNNQKLNPKNRKYASDFLEITSVTKYYNQTIENLSKRQLYEDIVIKDNAFEKKENLWYGHLNDTIDLRSNPTYVSVDSLMDKRKWENKLKIGRKVIKGYYPVYFFDFDLRYLFRYNNYEGFRLGLGGVSNEKLFKNYRIDGYLAYGTKDGQFKGMLSNAVRIHKKSDSWFGISYKDDVAEIANTSFEIDKRSYKIYDPRPFNISTFYNHETWKAFFETKLIPKTDAIFQVNTSFIEPKFDYRYNFNGNSITDFYASTFLASLHWNPFSKFMQTPRGKMEYDKNYPKFSFQFVKTLNGIAHNTYNFGSVNFRFDYQYKFNSNHKTMFLTESQYTFGNAPLTHLYNHSPNNLTKDKIIQRVTFAGKDCFETMYFNEFFSNKHLFMQLEHQFPKIQISRQIKPVFSIVSRYGIGSLANKERHEGLVFKTLEKGYQETGFELNQIYKGIGFVAFYRHGANHLSSFEDNLAIKLSVQINLGFNN